MKWAVGFFVTLEGPESLVVSGERALPVESATVLGAENSEVLPEASVAVAVMVRPVATLLALLKAKEALPEASVVTDLLPMNFLPSLVPDTKSC